MVFKTIYENGIATKVGAIHIKNEGWMVGVTGEEPVPCTYPQFEKFIARYGLTVERDIIIGKFYCHPDYKPAP